MAGDVVHVIQATIDPNVAPTRAGQHWVNTATSKTWLSVATNAIADWIRITEHQNAIVGWLQYRNNSVQTTTATNTTFTAVTLDTATDSFENGYFTKYSATEFQTDFNGYILVSYKLQMQNTSSNDVAARALIVKNGSALSYTEIRSGSKTNANRFMSTSSDIILSCSVGDKFQLGFGNGEAATDTISIPAGQAVMRTQILYVS